MGALVDKLQNLFSKQFLIGTFLPVFATALLNGMLLYGTNERARGWIRSHYPTGTLDAVLSTGTVSLFLIVGAFLLSSSTTYLRELLEGRHLPHWLEGRLVRRHSREVAALRLKLNMLRRDRDHLERHSRTWSADLSSALRRAQSQPPGTLPNTWDENFVWACEFQELRELHRHGRVLPFARMQDLVARLMSAAAAYAPDAKPYPLRLMVAEVNELVASAGTRYENEIVALFNHRNRAFGTRTVAPTKMGNLANALASYPEIRFGFSLDFAWSRLQKVLQKDDYNDIILDTKAQLDSAVHLLWLIGATSVSWSVVLALGGVGLPMYFAVSAGGGLVCYTLYNVACGSYLAFADVVRSVVDLYRFDLLKALHLPLPSDAAAERELWDKARRQLEFVEPTNPAYDHT